MRKIDIDSTESQEFSISFEGDLINIVLDFRQGNWFMNVTYNDKTLNGIRLACAVAMLEGKNWPFEIVLDDKGNGLDPYEADSFERGLFDFYLLERDEVELIRGFEVE